MAVGFYLGDLFGTIVGVALHRQAPSALLIILAYRRGWIDILKELRVVPVFFAGIAGGKVITTVAWYLGITN
jgi:hypothetical protein